MTTRRQGQDTERSAAERTHAERGEADERGTRQPQRAQKPSQSPPAKPSRPVPTPAEVFPPRKRPRTPPGEGAEPTD
ncbi:hypothetical protein [Streptomyces sp. NPDC005438]|uniref:hypothetical protein n=1 Tax=Streptomyces sp. NPDC005438 TaxID=3156880 RepID=UPI0033BA553E